ncbi:acyltransferase [soil metagenome]
MLLQHAGVLPVGWLGVDLFFALSGYLITGILLDARGAPAGAVLRAFYARRAVRIFPLGFLLLAVVFLALPLVTHVRVPLQEQAWYWLYASNWRPGNSAGALVYLRHFWSLAVEEQFYLAWPIAVLLLSKQRLWRACVTVLVGGLLLRCALPLTVFARTHSVLSLTVTRADALAVGAMVALMARGPTPVSVSALRTLGWIAAAIVAVLLWRSGGALSSVPLRTVGVTLIAVASGAVVEWAASRDGGALTWPGLTRLGTISYGVYVYHAPVAIWIEPRVPSPWLRLVMVAVLAVPVAALSWRYIERPILDQKWRWPMPRNRLAKPPLKG